MYSICVLCNAVPTDADAKDEGTSTSLPFLATTSILKNLSNTQIESILISGPPANPSSFSHDSYGRCFP